ncbi:MAG: RidA family protein [Burkholderiaceae bacterium]
MTGLRRIDLPRTEPGHGSAPGSAASGLSAASTRGDAPVASAVVIAGGMADLCGMRADDLRDARRPLPEMVEAQGEKIFANRDLLLAEAGLSRDRLVFARAHLVQFERLYPRVAQAWSRCIADAPRPALSCVGVERLTRGALVEIDFIVAA